MKKLALIAVVAGFAFASCKKDYTCTCTTTGNGQTASASTTIHASKKDAKDACEGDNSSSGGYTTTCELN